MSGPTPGTDSPRRRRGAVVLCGGQSRRMGADKAMLPFGGEALLARVVRIVSRCVPEANIVVVAAERQELPELSRYVRVVRDREEARGPLPAVIAGLGALVNAADAALVVACDAPLLRVELVEWLFARFASQPGSAPEPSGRPLEAIVPAEQGRMHPLLAVYSTAARVGFAAARSQGEYSLEGPLWSGLVNAQPIAVELLREVDPALDSLINCNTREDYERALQRAAELA